MNLVEAIAMADLDLCEGDCLSIVLACTAGSESAKSRQLQLSDFIQSLRDESEKLAPCLHFDWRGRRIAQKVPTRKDARISQSDREELRHLLAQSMAIGRLMLSLSASRLHRCLALGAALELAQTVNTNLQFKTYSDSSGNPAGALTWAWVEECRADAAIATGDLQLHPSEWNEGRCLWFRDVAVAAGSAQEMARDIGGGLFPEATECLVTMRSRKSGRTVAVKFSGSERASLYDWVAGQAELSANGGEGRCR